MCYRGTVEHILYVCTAVLELEVTLTFEVMGWSLIYLFFHFYLSRDLDPHP